MNKLAILDPDLFIIEDAAWSCPEKRDNFLFHLLSVTELIESVGSLKIAWCYQTEELLWRSPQTQPWRQDGNWSKTLMPVIYRKMSVLLDYLELDNPAPACSVAPELSHTNNDMYLLFLQLLNKAHDICEQSIVCLGQNNIPAKYYLCSRDGTPITPVPLFAECRSDYLSLIDFPEKYWPTSAGDKEVLKKGISLMLLKNHDIENPVVDFEFSHGFIRKLVITRNDRDLIMECICNRLSMNHTEARGCRRLRDETIEGKAGVFRIRVTGRPTSKRIHYQFKRDSIEFLMFYDQGEHDDGL